MLYSRFKGIEMDLFIFTGIRYKMRDVIEKHVQETIQFRTTLRGDEIPAIMYVDGCSGLDG